MILNIKAVIFDMDGVITNTMPDHFKAWKRVLKKYGLNITKLEVYKREGQQGLPSLLEIFAERKIPINLNLAKEIVRRKECLFKKMAKTRFIPGARSFLRFLKNQGLVLALVTGTSRHELERILPSQVRGNFKVIVTGSDVRKGKPDPEPYALALKRLGLDEQSAVAVENAPCGIVSAKEAGLRCLAVTTSLPRRYLKGADKIYSSIKELRENSVFSKERT